MRRGGRGYVVELEATVHEGGKGWGSSGGGLLPKQRKWREGGGCPARARAREGGGAWAARVVVRRRWGPASALSPHVGKQAAVGASWSPGQGRRKGGFGRVGPA
jgi:hypothetical protein